MESSSVGLELVFLIVRGTGDPRLLLLLLLLGQRWRSEDNAMLLGTPRCLAAAATGWRQRSAGGSRPRPPPTLPARAARRAPMRGLGRQGRQGRQPCRRHKWSVLALVANPS